MMIYDVRMVEGGSEANRNLDRYVRGFTGVWRGEGGDIEVAEWYDIGALWGVAKLVEEKAEQSDTSSSDGGKVDLGISTV
ncbi:uncharacterized protein N7498_010667 [Penicillium cinerascens]|uniref:Uncharacterized protein n=1 Tax=Penicillium cinerascens TaxID=70096 RepID=A0A9W9J8V8_9EURO|nr:uncharacterized protein N7498_010667 [Penicillium cinerascens]KAJ5191682.1 hypothetical protein N7498_010667 [Penicillium cinerascens]